MTRHSQRSQNRRNQRVRPYQKDHEVALLHRLQVLCRGDKVQNDEDATGNYEGGGVGRFVLLRVEFRDWICRRTARMATLKDECGMLWRVMMSNGVLLPHFIVEK
jgi:hypothetical protein